MNKPNKGKITMNTDKLYLVDTNSWFPLEKRGNVNPSTFKTVGAAKAAITRKKKKFPNGNWDRYEIMTIAEWDERRPLREVTNIRSGGKVMEKAGTPSFLSVASEAYHCM